MNLQRVLGDANFGLPYWDWAADGQKTPAQQKLSRVWAADAMGGSGSPVTTGPFGFNAGDPTTFRVRVEANVNGRLVQTNHGLRRALGTQTPRLPTKADTASMVTMTPYDAPPWDTSSAGFCNRLARTRPALTVFSQPHRLLLELERVACPRRLRHCRPPCLH